MTSIPGSPLARVSTGSLPGGEEVQGVLEAAYAEARTATDGTVADYIPALADADPDLFGACIAGVGGDLARVGDAEVAFSIQSISKPFVFALVCEVVGPDVARDRLGVNATGLPFDSVMAVELSASRTTNPMVNPGALATTSLVPGRTAEAKWAAVQEGLSRFAGRELVVDEVVHRSEAGTNQRNNGLAHLLDSYGLLAFDPDGTTDVYTRQCSLLVTATDLAVMGATLADGGVNPVTGERVVSADVCTRVLAVLATAGLYERTGEWLFDIGLPGKSGVSGGIVTIAPGKGGLGTFAPPLDAAGNSVRGTMLTAHLSRQLGLNLLASTPPA